MTSNRKLFGDSLVNFVSFGLLGLGGLAINYFVARRYGPQGLGEFNIAYSVYILLSQIAVGGSHLAILRYAANKANEKGSRALYFRAGLEHATKMSLWVVAVLVAAVLISDEWWLTSSFRVALLWIAPAVLCFSITKCYINYFNGVERLRVVGYLNSLRAMLLVVFVLLLCSWSKTSGHVVMAFFLSEMIVGAVCLGALDRGSLRGESRQEIPESIKADIRQHGFRVMPGNVMADINSRVDVLMLGVMVTQAQTGIYSLPAMLVDGLFNFTVVLRTIINGKLGRMRAQNDKAGLKKLVKVGVLISFSITLVMALALFLVYPMIIEYGSLSPDFLKGKTALLILLGLFASVSGILPFAMAPNQFGNPGTQTRFYGVVFLSNLFGNLIFIPIWGIEGAALASGLSFVVYGILISRYIQKEVF